MWLRGAAIRPVPQYAVIGATSLERIERELANDSARAHKTLDDAFSRFESTQPYLADGISRLLSKPLDETALALGYFLSIAIWLAFERTFSERRLREVSPDALTATEESIGLEEELRVVHGRSPPHLGDVVSIGQPNVLSFVHEHVEAAFDTSAAMTQGQRCLHVNVQDVRAVYRAIVLLTLCLSHAVVPVDGAAHGGAELIA